MKHSDDISHEGRIVEISSTVTTVEIVSESGCSSCHARSLCAVGESREKTIYVPTSGTGWRVGQDVNVFLRRTMGFKAVWIAYVVPLIVLVAALLCALGLGAAELVAGLVSLGAVAVYYFVIWLFRNRLRNEYVFYIEEKQ
ncbi:MAG: SoxR reducing system RseC family protein [Bacteroidales bacterium]|nr:SoxR reducing system RseC family protein [Bacteroidales bacterium]